jgi:hypothetical protein
MKEKNFTLELRHEPSFESLDSLAINGPEAEYIWQLKGGKVVDFAIQANGKSRFLADYNIKSNVL